MNRPSSSIAAEAFVHVACVLLLLGCGRSDPGDTPSAARPGATPHAPSAVTASASVTAAPPAPAATTTAAPTSFAEPPPRTLAALDAALFLDAPAGSVDRLRTCAAEANPGHCLLGLRFTRDPAARAIAEDMLDRFDSPAGVERDHIMDGGYRGMIHILPRTPEGAHRTHLAWVRHTLDVFATFFRDLRAAAGRDGPFPRYRTTHIDFRFMESENRTTPSADALDWRIGYNVKGSLLKSQDAVTETLFHEMFHLNDQAHDDYSVKKLTDVFEQVRRKCGARTACLAPYAPGDTMVRGGTYYAFQPGNDVREYAAELAVRYFREQSAMLAKKPLAKPAFKCGPQENALAFRLFVDEFFDGVDRTPACP